MSPLELNLRAGLTALGLPTGDALVEGLLSYIGLIGKWNRVYNLTAVRDPQDMLTHHVLDCLAVLPALRRQLAALPRPVPVLDVGAGAGLPGVVFALTEAGLRVDCVDTVAKKAAFVQQAAATLKLSRLRGLHARVESLLEPYPLICSRAFASLSDFTSWSAAALAPGGVWMAMKGKHPTDELRALPQAVEVFHVEHIDVPGLQAERCIVWMRRRGD